MRQFDFPTMRAAMVKNQLRTNNVTDPMLLEAVSSVARELFVPSGQQGFAYVDVPLPCSPDRSLNPPLVTARLIEAAELREGEHVLLVGSATGYAAALLSAMGMDTVALEEDDSLAAHARKALGKAPGVRFANGPFAEGWAKGAPYDAIVIDGAIEQLPDALKDQLRDGGRMTAGLRDGEVTRLVAGVKTGNSLTLLPFLDVEVVPLPGFSRPRVFSF